MQAALDEPVLVLNRLWQAINVIGARRAFALLARGHAHVVHAQADDYRVFSLMDWMDFSHHNPPLSSLEGVRTASRFVRLPRVILLTYFDQLPRKELKLTRSNVFKRDKNTCQYCGRHLPSEQLNLDHVIPRADGGARRQMSLFQGTFITTVNCAIFFHSLMFLQSSFQCEKAKQYEALKIHSPQFDDRL